jgi:hypothetical protein
MFLKIEPTLNKTDKCSIALCPAKRHKVKSQELAIMSVIPPRGWDKETEKRKASYPGGFKTNHRRT